MSRCPTCQAPVADSASSCPCCHGPLRHLPIALADRSTVEPDACPVCQTPLDPTTLACAGCRPVVRPVPLFDRATVPGKPEIVPPPKGHEDCIELDFALEGEPSNLDPARDYLVARQPGGRLHLWELTRPFYSIGREGAKISLPDRRVSRRHLSLARVGSDWVVCNRSDKRMRVNQRELVQRTLRSADVIRIGETWLLFFAGLATTPLRPLRASGPNPGARGGNLATLGSLDQETAPACQVSLLRNGQQVASSTGQPLLLGEHPRCGARLQGAGLASFHALLTWLDDGLHLVDLDSGRGTSLDGQPIRDGVVRDGQQIEMGDQRLTIRLVGDACAPARGERQRLRNAPVAVALTAIYGAHLAETTILPPGRAVRLGRGPDVDMMLAREPLLRASHLLLELEVPVPGSRPVVKLRDLGEQGDVLVNRETLAGSGSASIGDVIQFGKPDRVGPTALLVHHATSQEAW